MTNIPSILTSLTSRTDLSAEESEGLFSAIMAGEISPTQIAAILMVLHMKGEAVSELVGATKVLRTASTPINAPDGAIDTCGTGGDCSGTYNISTAVAIVVAACGVPVAKHGNKSVSSKSGSADVLGALGVKVDCDASVAEKSIQEVGIGFLFAPVFHQAMKQVAPVRKELGIRTIFNLIGPLSNPASTPYQLIGVFDKKWCRPFAEVLQQLGTKKAWVVHGSDGLDELTTCGTSFVTELNNGAISEFEIKPDAYGIPLAASADLKGGDAEENADAILTLLAGNHGPFRDIVLLNAAGALVVSEKVSDLQEGIALASEMIDNGAAKNTLDQLIAITNS